MFVIAAGLLFSQISKAQTAELQVIHNCADPAADSVDIYVNGALTLDNFAFRTATSFLTLPSGVDINVGVAPKNSSSAADTLKNFIFNLANGQRYVAVASGVLNTAGFSANPNGVNTGFTILVKTISGVLPVRVPMLISWSCMVQQMRPPWMLYRRVLLCHWSAMQRIQTLQAT